MEPSAAWRTTEHQRPHNDYVCVLCYTHQRRSGWNSGEHIASAESGSVPSGVRWGGVSSNSVVSLLACCLNSLHIESFDASIFDVINGGIARFCMVFCAVYM